MGGDIPEWMLFEVLLRLPMKVLFKFKIVSKQWHSMISDSSFARMFAARKSLLSQSQNWTLISSFATKVAMEQFFGKKLPLRGCALGMNCLDLFVLPEEASELHYVIVGISNGLVLYGPRIEILGRIYSYDICNPISGQWITLPPHEHCFRFVVTGFVTQVEDNVVASYRVVRIDASNEKSGVCGFEVYFSEIRKWVYYSIDFNQEICFNKWKNPVVLDKILHWSVTGHIMAYDPYNKPDSFRLISLPIESGGDKILSAFILFDEHQGHLRYFELLHERSIEFFQSLSIWVLNDYDSGEWCLRHRVIFDDIQCDGDLSKFLSPLCFHPFDSNTLYMLNKMGLLSYNMKTRKLELMHDFRKIHPIRFPFSWACFLFVIPPRLVFINPSSFEVTKD